MTAAPSPVTAGPSTRARGAVDAASFRHTLGQFPTGVVVVAASYDDEPHGLAANSFASVSLDPPLVSFCAAHTSATWPRLSAAGGFAVSILSAEQEHVARTFARKGTDRFAGSTWSVSPSGHPVFDDALAWLDCTLEVVHRLGDHDLAVARVVDVSLPREGDALVFFGGRYLSLAGPSA